MTATTGAAPARNRIDDACVRTLFRQLPNSFAAAGVVTAYMAATAAPFASAVTIGLWLAVQLSTQAMRGWLLLHYRRLGTDDSGRRRETAARLNTLYMLSAGLVWGATAFLFMDAAHPITVALTLCGLYGIAGGSVPGNAYRPVGLFLFIGAIFGLVMLRLALMGDRGYLVLGLASLAYAAILASFCRVQNREIREGFAIRFGNERLVAALEVEKAEAEAARARAEQANLGKSQLLAAASHDLRQPLHALSLFAESLDSLALDTAARDVVARIQTNVAAMESLFNGLLDMSRLEAGVVRSRMAPMSLRSLFDRLSGYCDGLAEREGVDLRFRDTDLWVMGDAVLTEQICVNLLTNAIRYAPGGGVLVAARRRGGRVSIAVTDTGMGIAEDDQARIFDAFVQLGNPERDRGKGLGLGLAIARRLAALQESRIILETRPGRGSRFSFDLAPAKPAAEPVRVAAAPDLVAGLRLLVIDDDPAVRDSTGLLLRQWGVSVALAADVAEADRLIAGADPFDICLSDYRLPGILTGLDVIARLKGRRGAPRAFALLTGDMDSGLLEEADAAGIVIVHKPAQPARLRALLNHLAQA